MDGWMDGVPFFAFFCSFRVSKDFFLISLRTFLYSVGGKWGQHFGMRCSTSRCPHTFGHVVYMTLACCVWLYHYISICYDDTFSMVLIQSAGSSLYYYISICYDGTFSMVLIQSVGSSLPLLYLIL